MALTPEQRKIWAVIEAVGRREGASPREMKAAAETLLVEAPASDPNPAYGHADSVGWRQERSHYGSVRNRMNVRKAAGRFFDEADALNTQGGSAGQLAQRVQRSAFPGRYDERSGDAEALIGDDMPPGRGGSRTRTIPGEDNSAARRIAILNWLRSKGEPGALTTLALGLQENRDTPDRIVTNSPRNPGGRRDSGGLDGPLHELFYNVGNAANVDEGRRVGKGFVSGHTDHAHVAAEPGDLRRLARMAERMGLHVGEYEPYDPVDPVHTQGSFHYSGRAADISGDPRKLARFTRRVARRMGV